MKKRQTIDLTLSDVDEVIDLTRHKSPSILSVSSDEIEQIEIQRHRPVSPIDVDFDDEPEEFVFIDTLPIVKLNHSWREVQDVQSCQQSRDNSSRFVRAWKIGSPRHRQGNELLSLRAGTRSQRFHSGPYAFDTRFCKKKLLYQTKEASGAITKVAQADGIVAAASSAWGGNMENPQSRLQAPDPYNQDGNLNIVHSKTSIKLSCHNLHYSISRTSGKSTVLEEHHKFYSVNDTAFCPTNKQCMVSTGNDRKLCVWDISEDSIANGVKEPIQFIYRTAPKHAAFKPESSILAVACGPSIHVHADLNDQRQTVILKVALPKGACGDFLWGKGNTLFASSEDDLDKSCQHIAADVETGETLYCFSADASGDALALSNKLDCLALITRTSTSHLLQIYDVDRGNGRYPISQTYLSHSQRADVEVTHAKFSPDDIFLALGRNDHLIEIYDLRFMKTPVQTYKQDLENRCLDKSREWGITSLHWTTDISRGLLSAGSDGCVRLWDVGRSSNSHVDTSGRVIVQVDHDIACMNIGDPWKREYSLVVGDSGGGVYLYD